jgi:hypothetical protein
MILAVQVHLVKYVVDDKIVKVAINVPIIFLLASSAPRFCAIISYPITIYPLSNIQKNNVSQARIPVTMAPSLAPKHGKFYNS